ncbi:MAG: twin-arginine translocase TatA/TatE family subunit [Chloroflexi bacterium]|nr:twin-arginine translocase TatA/TatE family subunit [Chloroflexota bacterium]
MPFNIQGPELILILIIALIVVGPGKLPDLGAALGRSIREFRKAATDVKDATSLDAKPAAPPVAPDAHPDVATSATAAPVAPPEAAPAAAAPNAEDQQA